MAKILVVDDSNTIRVTLRKTLEGAGHEVIEAIDGADGLAKLTAEAATVNLVLSDINMPNMDGITMCQKIKENEALKKIPVFVISTETSAEMKTKGKELGITAWMNKPPNPAKLLEAITKILELVAARNQS